MDVIRMAVPVRSQALQGPQASWQGLFTSTETEAHQQLNVASGKVPDEVKGTVFFVGPGKFDVNGDVKKNPFSGDGMVSALTIKDGQCYFRNRFIISSAYADEFNKGKVIYSTKPVSYIGGWAESFVRRSKNLGNRGAVYWGKLLLALWDGGLPWKIDPKNLETYFQEDLALTLKPQDKGGEPFSARPRVDAKNNRLVNFGYDGAGRVTTREFNTKFACGRTRDDAVPGGFTILADFGVTDRFYIYSVAALKLDTLPYNVGIKGIDDALRHDTSQKTAIMLVPRSSDAKQKTIIIETDTHMCCGVANAFDGEGSAEAAKVVIDMVRMESLRLGKARRGPAWEELDYAAEVPKRELYRYILDPARRTFESVRLCSHHVEHAFVSPAESCLPHRYVYGTIGLEAEAPSPGKGLARIDTETGEMDSWFPGDTQYIGAAALIAGGLPQVGSVDYVVATSSDGQHLTSETLIFKAADLKSGPVCRLPLPVYIPPPAHATGAAVAWDMEALEKSHKLSNLFRKKGWNTARSDFSGLGLNQFFSE